MLTTSLGILLASSMGMVSYYNQQRFNFVHFISIKYDKIQKHMCLLFSHLTAAPMVYLNSPIIKLVSFISHHLLSWDPKVRDVLWLICTNVHQMLLWWMETPCDVQPTSMPTPFSSCHNSQTLDSLTTCGWVRNLCTELNHRIKPGLVVLPTVTQLRGIISLSDCRAEILYFNDMPYPLC